MKKWLNIWKVRYNPSGTGSIPVYFDNKNAADEFAASHDYADEPVRICSNGDNPNDVYNIDVYKAAEDYDNDYYYSMWVQR